MHPVVLTAMFQRRPQVCRHDACLVCPLLREVPSVVDQALKPVGVEGAEAGEKHEQVGRNEHIHVIELQKAKSPDDTADMATVDHCGRARPVEALCSEGDTPRLSW